MTYLLIGMDTGIPLVKVRNKLSNLLLINTADPSDHSVLVISVALFLFPAIKLICVFHTSSSLSEMRH